MLDSLSRLWRVVSGAERREARRRSRAEWCRIRFDESAIEVEVHERPVWRNRVAWDDILAVGLEPEGILGPGLNLFIAREPGVVWASLEGTGGPELHEELRRRGIPFRPLADLWRELDQRLKDQARSLTQARFQPAEWPLVQQVLDACRGRNTGRTQVAIVRLADGQLTRVRELAAEAQRDGGAAIVSRDIAENMADQGR